MGAPVLEPPKIFDINPVVVARFLTGQDCEQLLQYFHVGEKASGKIRPDSQTHSSTDHNSSNANAIRNNTICWLDLTESTSWIYKRLSDLVKDINDKKYQFNIDDLQTIQLAEYKSSNDGEGQFYRPHLDTCLRGLQGQQRKLSISVQLTPSEDYEGGDLLLFGDQNDMVMDRPTFENNLLQRRQLGSAIIFPSFLGHEVTTVTKGIRHSLVAWMQGANWR